jgi:hypothetical protein
MAAIAITGKQFTVTVGASDYSAQVTTGSINKTADSETLQTLADTVTISKGVETTASCDFLYDGATGFYKAMWDAVGGSAVAVTITGEDGEWSGDMVVTSLSDEFPADGVSTCTAEFAGSLAFAAVI